MSVLYVTSTKEGAGRTTLCIGLGKALQAEGQSVGYVNASGDAGGRKDAEFVKQALGLSEAADSICPVSGDLDDAAMKNAAEAVGKIAKGKEVVLVEGAIAGADTGPIAKAAEATKAKVVLVARYGEDAPVDMVQQATSGLGDRLIGVVFNAVPESKREAINDLVIRPLKRGGAIVLGVMPEIRALFSVSVGELAEHVGGSVLNSEERADELIENCMVGALSADSALSYLTLKGNKAVITRGDHADIQLAALTTSTKCLVLTGGIEPLPAVMSRARELEVPIVKVEKDTVSTMEALESVLDKAGEHVEKRAQRLGQITADRLDLRAINEALLSTTA
jgi:hypothetical protein